MRTKLVHTDEEITEHIQLAGLVTAGVHQVTDQGRRLTLCSCPIVDRRLVDGIDVVPSILGAHIYDGALWHSAVGELQRSITRCGCVCDDQS